MAGGAARAVRVAAVATAVLVRKELRALQALWIARLEEAMVAMVGLAVMVGLVAKAVKVEQVG